MKPPIKLNGPSEDELLVRRASREFVDDNLVPIVEECFRDGRFRALARPMDRLGFYCVTCGATAARKCRTSTTAW